MIIDELMPVYDVKAAYAIRVAATPRRVWQECMNADFSQMPLARFLMAIRTIGRKKSPPGEPHTLATMGARGAGGFFEIARVDGKEIVLGVIGRFWRPDAPTLRDWKPQQFSSLSPQGNAKAAWNFFLTPIGEQTLLSTETRVLCYGSTARVRFRAYWTLIGFFSGLIRKEMLQMIKRNSERQQSN